MIESFKANPLLLLFVVSAIGYWLGNISFKGAKLGVAAVLFVGLAFGALDPNMNMPEIVIFLGLSIFVYTIGLASGPGFFNTFKRSGFRDVTFVIGILIFAAMVTVSIFYVLDLDAATASGLLAGSTNSTPALAGLLDVISKEPDLATRAQLSNNAVVGYSLSYPMGVIGVMLAIFLFKKWFKIDFTKEEEALQDDFPIKANLTRSSIIIKNEILQGKELRLLFQKFNRKIVFGRMKKGEENFLPNMDTKMDINDQIVIVGSKQVLREAAQFIGEFAEQELSYDRSVYDARRIFVSNPKIVGEKIASLNLAEKHSTIITRVQRGDMDVLANGQTVLELGDRVLIVAKRSDFKAIKAIFGDSYEALSHINLLSFGSGMALGLLLGMIQFELPGNVRFNLGYAGGPLIVGLLLGALRRTGPIAWTLPYSANLTLRQIGLILLLAGIGIRSGHTFLETISGAYGWKLFASGAVIAITTAIASILVGFRLLKIPYSLLIGMIAHQPAILDYSLDLSKNKLPTIGYTTTLPVSLIVKILLVQVVYLLLT